MPVFGYFFLIFYDNFVKSGKPCIPYAIINVAFQQAVFLEMIAEETIYGVLRR